MKLNVMLNGNEKYSECADWVWIKTDISSDNLFEELKTRDLYVISFLVFIF